MGGGRGKGGLAKRFKVASPQLSRNPRGFGLPAYGCRGPSRAGMYIRTATPRVPKGAWPPLPGSTPRGSPQFPQHRLRMCVPCPAVLASPKRIPGDSEKDAWGRRKGSLGSAKPAFPEVQHGVSNWGDRRELDIYIYITGNDSDYEPVHKTYNY